MSTKRRLLLNLTIFAGFMAAYNPEVTGLAIHEWASIALVGLVGVHLVTNWDWTVRMAGRVFERLKAAPRVNFVVDVALFVSAVAATLSGVMVSRIAAPAFSAATIGMPVWHTLHSAASTAVILLIATHFALHWKWFVRALRLSALQPAHKRTY